jgi:shikimate 5-dehydrogenase
MSTADALVPQQVPTMYFFGVTTGQSAIMRIFPAWAAVLQLEGAQLVGLDFPIHAPAEDYRRAVAHIKEDALSLGALITTHKVDVLKAARDLFDTLDDYAQLCGEVSCIAKRDGRLIAYARDPVISALALQEFIPADYWGRSGAHVLCLGGGGSAAALLTAFLTRPAPEERPTRLIVVNRSRPRLDELAALVARLPYRSEVRLIVNEDLRQNDRLMSELPPGSLVINATGMGKDRPGSPISDEGLFPLEGFVWDLNYRGELGFLRQARAQQAARRLQIHDGWRYFLHSWIDHIARVFQVTPDAGQRAQMAAIAESMRT